MTENKPEEYRKKVDELGRKLLDVIASVTMGDYNVNIDIPEDIEVLADLSVGLQFLIEDLREMESGQERIKQELESRVAQRTRELEIAVKELQATQSQLVQSDWKKHSASTLPVTNLSDPTNQGNNVKDEPSPQARAFHAEGQEAQQGKQPSRHGEKEPGDHQRGDMLCRHPSDQHGRRDRGHRAGHHFKPSPPDQAHVHPENRHDDGKSKGHQHGRVDDGPRIKDTRQRDGRSKAHRAEDGRRNPKRILPEGNGSGSPETERQGGQGKDPAENRTGILEKVAAFNAQSDEVGKGKEEGAGCENRQRC